jgi:IS605 OrfB family transposase
MKRAILLQTSVTRTKQDVLESFAKHALSEYNRVLKERVGCGTFMAFHRKVFDSFKPAGFNSQVKCDLERNAWRKKGNDASGVTVKFNVPRNCSTSEMKKFFFVVLGLYPKKRIAVPIRKNPNFQRFQCLLKSGWTCKTYGLTPSLEICAYLSKEDGKESRSTRKNIVGIDINAKNFAYTILTPGGRTLKQGYLGKQIWPKKLHFGERRAMLQSLGALKKLKRMRHRQRHYVKTNLGQIVREIVSLAKRYDADIAIERLSKFKRKGRRFNNKVLTIPFRIFRMILEGRCFDNGIGLSLVDAYHTSKWCSHCGAVGDGHDGNNYALFKCRACGQVVNSDRKASLAVAVKAFLERSNSRLPYPRNADSFQISGKRVPVMALRRRVSDDPRLQMAVPMRGLGEGKANSL